MESKSSAKDVSFDEITIGDADSFEVRITLELISQFAALCGDYNPLHMDVAYAATTKFKKPVAHGMLFASFLSRFVGMYLPGKHALYLSQSLNFKNPVFAGDTLRVQGRVIEKSESTKVITIATKIYKTTGELILDGEARVFCI